MEYRIKWVSEKRFRILDSKIDGLRQLAHGSVGVKLQSRKNVIEGDDSTWTDVDVTEGELAPYRPQLKK